MQQWVNESTSDKKKKVQNWGKYDKTKAASDRLHALNLGPKSSYNLQMTSDPTVCCLRLTSLASRFQCLQ